MKANLYPHLGQRLLPALLRCRSRSSATSSIAWQLRGRGSADSASISTTWTSSTRTPRMCAFSRRRGTARCMTPVELVEGHADALEGKRPRRSSSACVHGESLGLALVHEDVSVETRRAPARALRQRRARRRSRSPLSRTTPRVATRRRLMAELAVDERPPVDGAARRRRAQNDRRASRWCRSSRCWSCTASTATCRCFWRRSRRSLWRCSASCGIPKMRGLALREALPGIREVLLSVSAVPVDHAADERGLLRRDAGARPAGHRDARAVGTWRSRSFWAAPSSRPSSTTTSSPTLRRAALRRLRRQVAAFLRDGADRGLRARRLLDAHRVRAVGRRVRVHPARCGQALHAGPMDQGDDASHRRNHWCCITILCMLEGALLTWLN